MVEIGGHPLAAQHGGSDGDGEELGVGGRRRHRGDGLGGTAQGHRQQLVER